MDSRAAIYARISDDDEGTANGVKRQEIDCRNRAKQEGYAVVECYVDNDISASTISKKSRPAYERMLDDARDGRFDLVVAYSNSRLTRRPRELEDLIDLHDKHGTRFLTIVSGDDNLGTADGRMVARIKASVDAAEAERTAERIKRKMLSLAEEGRYVGPRPFGWDFTGARADRGLVVNQSEAAVLRECVERVLRGDTLWKITNDLNSRSIPTSTGRAWKTQVLRRVLLRDMNKGIRAHRPMKRGVRVERAMYYAAQWDAIISPEIHDQVVAKLTDPARKTSNRGTAPKYLLTSVARCGECGNYVVGVKEHAYEVQASYVRKDGTRGGPKTRIYRAHYKCPTAGCMKVVRDMEALDRHVTAVLLRVLHENGIELLGGDELVAKSARANIAALEAKLALAADEWADDALGMSDEQLRRVNAAIKPKLDAERARLAGAQPVATLAEFAGQGVVKAWERADIPKRKELIRLLGMQIVVNRVGPGNGGAYDPDSVSITWART